MPVAGRVTGTGTGPGTVSPCGVHVRPLRSRPRQFSLPCRCAVLCVDQGSLPTKMFPLVKSQRILSRYIVYYYYVLLHASQPPGPTSTYVDGDTIFGCKNALAHLTRCSIEHINPQELVVATVASTSPLNLYEQFCATACKFRARRGHFSLFTCRVINRIRSRGETLAVARPRARAT